MSKYSSDSDSSGDDSYHRRKKDSGRSSKRRSRSSSESSSSGSRHSTARKRSRKKRKCKSRRSRSRDRKAKSSRSRRNRSGDDRSRSSLRSKSWSRSRSNSKSRSTSPASSKRLRTYRRSPSSGSQDSHNRTDLKGSARASSSREAASCSSSSGGTGRGGSEDQLSAKLQAAIRAAQTADQLLRQQGVLLPPPQVPTNTSCASTKSLASSNANRNITVSEHTDPGALDEINAPGFVQRNFVSNGKVETSSEQAADIISSVVASTLASKVDASSEKDSLFHPNLLVNSQVKMDKWVKKLFSLRQKAINGEPLV